MENKFEAIINNFEEREEVKIGNQTFKNEIITDYTLQCSVFGALIFHETNFQDLDLTGTTMINCEFHNCKFKNVTMRKCYSWGLILKNCFIEQCNLTRMESTTGTIQNCTIIDSDLRASHFSEFNFIETKFYNNMLSAISARSVKILASGQSTEIEGSSSFGDFLTNMNSND